MDWSKYPLKEDCTPARWRQVQLEMAQEMLAEITAKDTELEKAGMARWQIEEREHKAADVARQVELLASLPAWAQIGRKVRVAVLVTETRAINPPVGSVGVVDEHARGYVWVKFRKPFTDADGEYWPRDRYDPERNTFRFGYRLAEIEPNA